MGFRLKVHYKGGSGMSTDRDSLQDVLSRLRNIAALDSQGSAVVTQIEITRIDAPWFKVAADLERS